jgi:hypothetical protein
MHRILLVLLLGASTAHADGKPKIDPKADKALREMSELLASAQSFRVESDTVDQVVLKSGQKIETVSESQVSVKRPNRLRSEHVGRIADVLFVYDGKTFTLFGKKAQLYATAPAPGNLTEAIDAAREEFGLDAPGGDLLVSNVYKSLMEDVVSGEYVGTEPCDGATCHHVAYRGADVDFQLWIETGARPVPHRYVITSKKEVGQPEFTVHMTHWEIGANLKDELFEFKPPPGAKHIPFLLRQQRAPQSSR